MDIVERAAKAVATINGRSVRTFERIGFIKCDETTYMVSLCGKSVMKSSGPFRLANHTTEA